MAFSPHLVRPYRVDIEQSCLYSSRHERSLAIFVTSKVVEVFPGKGLGAGIRHISRHVTLTFHVAHQCDDGIRLAKLG